MRHLVRLGSCLLLSVLPVLARTVTPPTPVQQEVARVVDAHMDMKRTGDTEMSTDKLDLALSSVLNDSSRVGDEALAVLLGFYVGEHPSEDIACDLVARGARVLKYLRKYESAQVVMPDVSSALPEPVKTEYPLVIRRIQSGDRCTREP